MRPSPRTANRSRGTVALIGFVLLCTAAGVWLVVARFVATPPVPGMTATVDGLAVDVHEAGWVPMDAHTMDSQSGFQMPAQMMPGAPAGDDMRLGIALTLLNTEHRVVEFNLVDEFVLVGGTIDGAVRLHSDTFGLLGRLTPGSAVNGVLYFDTVVPSPTDPPLVLRWVRDGQTTDLGVRLGEANPAPHPHGS
jgi:hypothetical protein